MWNNPFSARLDDLDALLMRLEEVIILVQSGQKIKAIKIYREDTGASLADAKAAVERLEQALLLETTTPAERPLSGRSRISEVELEQEVERLVRERNKILAIKFYRERTGVGLREAKAAVDRIEYEMNVGMPFFDRPDPDLWKGKQPRDTPAPRFASDTFTVSEDVQSLILAGKKIQAIKLYREQTGLGLREAKDAVDAMERDLGLGPRWK